MKVLKTLLIVFLFSSLFASCSDDDDNKKDELTDTVWQNIYENNDPVSITFKENRQIYCLYQNGYASGVYEGDFKC